MLQHLGHNIRGRSKLCVIKYITVLQQIRLCKSLWSQSLNIEFVHRRGHGNRNSWQHNTVQTAHNLILFLMLRSTHWNLYQMSALISYALVSTCSSDGLNLILGTFSTARLLSHDIMGWYWQAPTSCLMLWDFTGYNRGQKHSSCIDGGPISVFFWNPSMGQTSVKFKKQIMDLLTHLKCV